ncbi:MAG TPA: flagellar hook-associated protein FlgK [Treponemataceae bacterium]|nr:flagellar hook-associated protein FlgK [Treponemataceae bacterium]HQL05312.1 flagellar hook-associated protein FlgK [Treponemataceae bacterium]
MSTFSGIEIGKRSLMAHSQQIHTAGHNISNADTEGYSRQRVNIRAYDPLYRPDLSRAETPGQIGQGSSIESINRVRDALLDSRITAQSNQEGYWAKRESYYQMIENIYNEPADISVRTNMDKFWESWQELSLYPESKAARQAVVTRGESLIDSIKQRYNGLSGIGNLLNGDIEATVKQVNTYTKDIALLNSEIVRSKAMGDNPNDLLDRRDALIEKLSSIINITTDSRDSDEFMVHVDGKILVQGNISRSFEVEPLTDGTGYSKIVWEDSKNDAYFSGGSLGALVELRDVDIRNEIQGLNTMTMNFADLVNDIHRNAVGANNTTGLDFFVEQPFVTNALGNFDRNSDGIDDTSYIFRMTGTNALNPQDKIGLEGTMILSGSNGNVEIPYFPTDTVETVIAKINNSTSEVKAYLDRNNELVLKATTARNSANPDFVIRYIEDSGYFLAGYAGLLNGTGPENAYNFDQANAVNSLSQTGASFSVAPVLNPAGYISINQAIQNDVLSVASSFPASSGIAEAGDGSAALAIASIRNTSVMIGENKTFDDYFAESVTKVGLKGEQAEIALISQNSIMSDLRTLRDSISGVNIDEELADIIKFQHGYNAAAKFISIMDELLNTVINGLGV